ncbi:hypothetical protein A0H81_02355 [Grifola frondosa]|uniref:Uncharacterized protein n=1 Tax=Grifola frondosa TaxID=5627 RepID=A0A1C7MKR2_GRIFR|nr:hypothetical protein A0H81_02355 [Grifola frondosa]
MSSTNNSQKSRFPYYSTAPSDAVDATQGASQIHRHSYHEEKEFTAQPYVNAPPFRHSGLLYTSTPTGSMHLGCLSTQPLFPSHFPASHPSSNIRLYPPLQNDAHFQPFNLADPSLSVHASAVSVAFEDVRVPSVGQPGSHPTYYPMPLHMSSVATQTMTSINGPDVPLNFHPTNTPPFCPWRSSPLVSLATPKISLLLNGIQLRLHPLLRH